MWALTEFHAWLVVHGKSERAAARICAVVRAALDRTGDPYAADALRLHTAGLSPGERRRLLVAWRALRIWVAQRLPGASALPDFALDGTDLPPVVEDAVWVLHRLVGAPLPVLARTRWGHVRLDLNPPRIVQVRSRAGGSAAHAYACTGRAHVALESLRSWGCPTSPTSPLVPVQPGDLQASPLPRLRAAVQHAERREVERQGARTVLPGCPDQSSSSAQPPLADDEDGWSESC